MTKKHYYFLGSIFFAGALIGASPQTSLAQSKDLAKQFNSKPVTIIVPTSPGGG